jgi:Tol biopolymer transport system component
MDLAGSPDGRYFAYVDARDYSSQVGQIFVYDIEEAKGEAVTEGYASVWSPSWSSDGSYLYFVSNRGGSMDLWQRRMRGRKPVGDPQPLTTGVGITSASFSPDGTRLAYSKGRLVSNVWRIPILSDRPATWADAQQITFDEVYVEMLDVSPDGRRLIISSDRAGNPDLWILSVEGGEMEQVTTDPTPDWAPRWSPDGEQVAFYSYRSGNREIWVQPLRGGAARQVTKGEAESAFPTWSPDGREIAFLSFSSGNRHLWALPATGGSARQITRPPADDFEPSWSPNGKALAFFSTRSGAMNLWRVPADGGEPKQVSEEEGWVPRWSPDGKWIYFVGEGENTGNLWSIPADGGRARPLTDLSGRRGSILGSALAADGRYIYFAWQEGLADIWAANVEYP